jgi:dipeptidyl aminopeptidase/acylaminoacyl peptidase
MNAPTIAPFGSWSSPITADRVAAGVTPLSSPRLRGDAMYWLQGLPAEGGRVVAMRARAGAAPERLTPPGFNVRTRVHEYGGGAYVALDGGIAFSNFADNLVYLQRDGGEPVAITAHREQRHADFEFDARRQRLIAVREDHSGGSHEPRNSIVALSLDGGAGLELASGHDFYAAPRLSPDGTQLAWLTWDHPAMPWNGTELWLAEVQADGSLGVPRCVAGGPGEALVQPCWSPRGELFVVSDRTGWWNLYRVDASDLVPVLQREAEFGRPMWVFGQSMFGFNGPDEIVAACIDKGVSRLLRIALDGHGHATELPCPFTDLPELQVGAGLVLALASSPSEPDQIVRIDVAGGRHETLARSATDLPHPRYLSTPRVIDYPSTGGRAAHAFFYTPANADFTAPAGSRPPLIVTSHGGPTSMANHSLKLNIQFWTSRGFAVLDVNYGGSSGYGREYRNLLAGQWGIVDVDDCVAGAQWLAQQGLVDADRMAIRGGSASGFTTLCALAFHRVFRAGASHFGVSDLQGLDDDTHKFESRYTTWLIGPPERKAELYAQRSPVRHAALLSCPMIFFQGLDDKVVLPAQSQVMVDALKTRGVPVAYLAFEGEGHGFRKQASVQRALEAELYFFGRVFGVQPAGPIEPVEIFNAGAFPS